MPIPILDDVISYGKVAWSLVTHLARWLQRNKRKLTPQEKLDLRLKWKAEFERHLAEQRKEEIKSIEVIIRDVRRMDLYPDVSSGKGISAWFRADLIYTYDHGIMVGLSWEELKIVDGDKLRFCNWQEPGDITLMRTGCIPYEGIETVDWDGDRYYSDPHIYCYFDQLRKQPYERIAFCEKRGTNRYEFWLEVADYDDVQRLSKKMRIKRYPS